MRIDIEHLSVDIGGARLLRDIDLGVAAGQVVGLVGPNGSGKSTLLRCVYRALRPADGVVRLDGEDLHTMDARAAARGVAALPQDSAPEFDFTVAEVVAMGRLPHQRASALGRPSANDIAVCSEALERAGAGHLADRTFLTLSGGERQRVLMARAFAQSPRVLVLDEPTNHLDIAHQLDLLALVRDWRPPGSGRAVTVLTALHDLNLAAEYCDLLYVISQGSVIASGPPDEVLAPELLADVFGVRAHRVRHPETGALRLLFDRLPAQAPIPVAALPEAAVPEAALPE
ncbi:MULTISPECIES: ABC transporter ATP-binding protein [Streptomyces]|uniref:ABC transporter ATP-binding protein n=1 Tax=Streptomyces achmelvichensis TaxID=3134111 RepID=A0ACC6Q723_9ACTN|nr:ABC transporter ATP-binding protein [Streptomyces sp. NBC_01167]